MKTDPSCAPSFTALRRALVMAGGTLLLATSCSTPEDYNNNNIFGPGGPSRYGYGGTQTLPPGSSSSNTTKKTAADNRKVPDIKRDPSNTTVDVTPPEPKPNPNTTEDTATSSSPDSTSPPVEPSPPPSSTPAPREDLPFGRPVIGNPGFVYSPYAPDSGHVDVQGISAGTKVRCPYTKKVFRVP